ncbi:FecR family protein [Pedobacter frigoris]|uniref:FecR family protein n=1 Tax=Pedobacter frigoris TaxID=2571272 RepID=A0A4V5NYL3_9SPHI|nr:FecR family protein [Pedobacter frigoris]TKC04390.1 FecR family protein [Pedobacter frigoris]
MNKERVDYLHQQYIHNQMSSSEFEEWKSLVGNLSSEEDIKVAMDDHWTSFQDDHLLRMPVAKSDAIYNRMLAGRKIKRIYWKWIAAAAAIIMVVGSVSLLNSTDDRIHVEAGKNTATLTLPNGKAIALSDAKSGLVIDAGKLTYDDGSSVSDAAVGLNEDNEAAMLSISTPKGGTYEIVLRDGTHVWLNADSKLEFPAKFLSSGRVVKLSGEGYFEVAKNKQAPFRVLTKVQEIEVLGTHFNVDAYDNEKSVKTTLLEGLVKVSANGVDKLLDPGFQSVNTGNRISIAKVDVNAAIAWKNKQFVFESENIKSIMRKVERWYNVEVIYTDEVSEETFSGGVSRFDNLSEVLKSLESTGNVSFKVKGRIVYVSR